MPQSTHVTRTLLVANPAARSGATRALIGAVRAALSGSGHHVTVAETTKTHVVAPDLLEAGFDLVACLGGDGTFRRVGEVLLDLPEARRPTLALLPAGTANNVAHALSMPHCAQHLERAVAILIRGETSHLDAGRLTTADGGRAIFFDSVGWGLQAAMLGAAEDAAARTAAPRDHAHYAREAARYLIARRLRLPRFDATLEAEGERWEARGLTDLIVSGVPLYGGLWRLDPGCRIDDGRFEVVSMYGLKEAALKAARDLELFTPWPTWRRLFPSSLSNNRVASRLQLTMRAEAPMVSQMDGDKGPDALEVTIEVLHRALEVVVG